MGVTVVVRDETAAGRKLGEKRLSLPDTVTVREIIRHRVREEVARYNLELGVTFVGLVQPTEAEASLDGYRLRAPRALDWEQQAEVAVEGFTRNAFFVVVGARQVEDLDGQLRLQEADDVAFVRLVPLVGG